MTYQEAENFLLSLSNLPRRQYMAGPKQSASHFKRIQFFLDLIGNPEKKILHYIHVTGTSGKGSVCSYLASIMQKNNEKIGLYVSPHSTYLTERWQINHRPMSQKDFVRIILEIKPKLDHYIRHSAYEMLSFFDLSTIIALYYFAEQKVNWAIIEVGCGGRYDSTNIIPHKNIAVITNVGLDHMEILGNTKEKIAYQKVGIIKPGCVVFTSEKNPRVLNIIKKECTKNKVKFIQANSHERVSFLKNTELAKKISHYLNIPHTTIKKGLKYAPQPLRFEIIQKNPTIILDGAHNPDKIKSTIKSILELMGQKKLNKKLHLLLGFSHNKNIRQMIEQLSILKPKTVVCTRQTINPFRKVADPHVMLKYFKKYSPNTAGKIFLDPSEAFRWIRNQTKINDSILITGSIFLSGELRPQLLKDSKKNPIKRPV